MKDNLNWNCIPVDLKLNFYNFLHYMKQYQMMFNLVLFEYPIGIAISIKIYKHYN